MKEHHVKKYPAEQIHRREFLAAAAVLGVGAWLTPGWSGQPMPSPPVVGVSGLSMYFRSV
jgi:hypothetical protein